MIIITGETSNYVKLFSALNLKNKKTILVQSTDVATGLCLKDHNRYLQTINVNKHYKNTFHFSAEEKYNRSEIDNLWKRGRLLMYVRKDKSVFLFRKKFRNSRTSVPELGQIYLACLSERVAKHVPKTFIAGNSSTFLPTANGLQNGQHDVLPFDFRMEDLFLRFLSIEGKSNMVFGHLMKFQNEKEILHYAEKHDAIILFEGTDKTYEF